MVIIFNQIQEIPDNAVVVDQHGETSMMFGSHTNVEYNGKMVDFMSLEMPQQLYYMRQKKYEGNFLTVKID